MLKAIPISDKAVLSTSTLIDWEGVKFLLDIGPGTISTIQDRKLGLAQIQFILISHSHIDHFWDIVPFLWLRRMLGYKKRVCVVCPKSEIELFLWCGKISQAGDLTDVIGIEPRENFQIAGFNVKAFQVKHAKDQLCLGYIISEEKKLKLKTEKLKERKVPEKLWRKLAKGETIEYKGKIFDPKYYSYPKQRKIVYSGDTSPCEELVDAVKGATLFIAEATFLDRSYKQLANEYGHMIVEDSIRIGTRSKVENILLTHRSLRHTPNEFQKKANEIISEFAWSPRLFIGVEPIVID